MAVKQRIINERTNEFKEKNNAYKSFSISLSKSKSSKFLPAKSIIDKEESAQIREIELQLKKDGQTGVSETDVLILKNVLEVLPSQYFDKKVKDDSLDMDEKEIHETLLSYRGKKQ